jgi:hypothetical protein
VRYLLRVDHGRRVEIEKARDALLADAPSAEIINL